MFLQYKNLFFVCLKWEFSTRTEFTHMVQDAQTGKSYISSNKANIADFMCYQKADTQSSHEQ